MTEVPRPASAPAPPPAPAPPAVPHYTLPVQSQPSSSFYPQQPSHTPTAPVVPPAAAVQQGIMNLDAEKQVCCGNSPPTSLAPSHNITRQALLIQVISMTPEQLMAIPPQDRIQIQTVVRAALVDSIFLSHPPRREPPSVFHLSSFRVHKLPMLIRWT